MTYVILSYYCVMARIELMRFSETNKEQ